MLSTLLSWAWGGLGEDGVGLEPLSLQLYLIRTDTERPGLGLFHIVKTLSWESGALEIIKYNPFKYSPNDFIC